MRFFVRNLSRFSIRCGSVKRSFDLLYAHPLHFFSFPALSSSRPIFLGERKKERSQNYAFFTVWNTLNLRLSSMQDFPFHNWKWSPSFFSKSQFSKKLPKIRGEWPIRRKWSLASLKSQCGPLKMIPVPRDALKIWWTSDDAQRNYQVMFISFFSDDGHLIVVKTWAICSADLYCDSA